jgi:hypothetical protein
MHATLHRDVRVKQPMVGDALWMENIAAVEIAAGIAAARKI